jgi:hypothetical protein
MNPINMNMNPINMNPVNMNNTFQMNSVNMNQTGMNGPIVMNPVNTRLSTHHSTPSMIDNKVIEVQSMNARPSSNTLSHVNTDNHSMNVNVNNYYAPVKQKVCSLFSFTSSSSQSPWSSFEKQGSSQSIWHAIVDNQLLLFLISFIILFSYDTLIILLLYTHYYTLIITIII